MSLTTSAFICFIPDRLNSCRFLHSPEDAVYAFTKTLKCHWQKFKRNWESEIFDIGEVKDHISVNNFDKNKYMILFKES